MSDNLSSLNLTHHPTIGSIKKLIGEEDADKLSYEFGGNRIYIPKKVGEHHPIAVCVGLAQAKKICEAWYGHNYNVPFSMAKKHRAVALRKSGLSMRQVAIKLTMSERHVYRMFADTGKTDKNQFNLL